MGQDFQILRYFQNICEKFKQKPEMSEVTERQAKQPKRDTLIAAVDRADPEAVRRLLADGTNVDKADLYGDTPIRMACLRKNAEILNLLIKAGADVNRGIRWAVPLSTACRMEWTDGVRILIAAGADTVNTAYECVEPPMYHACVNGNPEIIGMLLRAGVDKDAPLRLLHGLPRVPLVAACRRPKNVRALIDAGADVNRVDENGDTPLHHSCYNGKVETTEMLLAAGAVADAENNAGMTPLAAAVRYSYPWGERIIRRHLINRAKPGMAAFCAGVHARLGESSPVNLLIGFPWVTRYIAVNSLPEGAIVAEVAPELC